MQLKICPGYEGGISTGQRQNWTYYGSGPASYSQTNGDALVLPTGVYLDSVTGCMDTTHTYILYAYPSVVGTTRATWTWKWYVAATGAEVANGVNLSTFNVQFQATGGEF